MLIVTLVCHICDEAKSIFLSTRFKIMVPLFLTDVMSFYKGVGTKTTGPSGKQNAKNNNIVPVNINRGECTTATHYLLY